MLHIRRIYFFHYKINSCLLSGYFYFLLTPPICFLVRHYIQCVFCSILINHYYTIGFGTGLLFVLEFLLRSIPCLQMCFMYFRVQCYASNTWPCMSSIIPDLYKYKGICLHCFCFPNSEMKSQRFLKSVFYITTIPTVCEIINVKYLCCCAHKINHQNKGSYIARGSIVFKSVLCLVEYNVTNLMPIVFFLYRFI